jgi:hypothetical protein
MKRVQLAGLILLLCACTAQAQFWTTFSYSQTDATTGSGTIAPFTINTADGPIVFGATPMPSALVVNPGTGQFVGQQTTASGATNEANVLPGLSWTGSVTATGTRGSEIYTVQIPLKFVPKVNQGPDTNDYNWNVVYGDDAAGGTDVISTNVPTGNPRFAMFFSRDTVIDATETPNTFQRYTQLTHAFTTGQNTFTNTDLSTGTPTSPTIKDATDAGNPAGVDAAGRDLAFYFGWRDQGTLTPQVVLVDTFTVGGLLSPDMTTLIPEPTSLMALAGIGLLGLARRRRA